MFMYYLFLISVLYITSSSSDIIWFLFDNDCIIFFLQICVLDSCVKYKVFEKAKTWSILMNLYYKTYVVQFKNNFIRRLLRQSGYKKYVRNSLK